MYSKTSVGAARERGGQAPGATPPGGPGDTAGAGDGPRGQYGGAPEPEGRTVRMTVDQAHTSRRHARATASMPGEGSATRQRILEIALSLMSQRGVDGTSMRDLAGAAGLNVASLYHYFPSKRDLLEAVLVEQGIHPIESPLTDGGAAERSPPRSADLLDDDHRLHVRRGGLRAPDGRRGHAGRGHGACRGPRPVRHLRELHRRLGDARTAPTSRGGRAPTRWPGCSAPWSSGSSSSTPAGVLEEADLAALSHRRAAEAATILGPPG